MGYGLHSLMALAAALSMGQSSAVVMTNPNAGNATPALGNAINYRSVSGPAAPAGAQPVSHGQPVAREDVPFADF